MRANRSESAREVAFRQALWREGTRGYRVHPSLPGRPDMAFPRLRLAVFLNGCFWHRCPICNLPEPKANAQFWRQKFADNIRRDENAQAGLESLGWTVVTIWEHEIRPNPIPRARDLALMLDALRMSDGELH